MKKDINIKISNFIFLLVVSVLLVFFNALGYLGGLKSFVVYLMVPFEKIMEAPSNSVNEAIRTLESIDNLKRENAMLRKDNLKLTYEITSAKETERENKVLREQLNFTEQKCAKGSCIHWLMAKVVGRNPDNYGRSITIDQGKKQGIEINQAVVVAGGVLIGKIMEVYDSSAKVRLLADPESSINSIIESGRANGIVRGKYGTGVKLEMVNQNEQLSGGDLVVTSGLEDKIPKGLLIGKVSNVEESANKVFKSADIDLFADFNHLEEVFIEKNGQ